jgi:hypothetical protein
MKGRMDKVGDWSKVGLLVKNLPMELKAAQVTALKHWGLKAEGIAKKHISAQDLSWAALSPAYLAAKVRAGHSENTLVATSSYFQSITSWVDVTKMESYAGVKKTAKDEDGNIIADIAATHEFGSVAANIPARPLWQPTFEETMEWFLQSDSRPAIIFSKNIKKYGV